MRRVSDAFGSPHPSLSPTEIGYYLQSSRTPEKHIFSMSERSRRDKQDKLSKLAAYKKAREGGGRAWKVRNIQRACSYFVWVFLLSFDVGHDLIIL